MVPPQLWRVLSLVPGGKALTIIDVLRVGIAMKVIITIDVEAHRTRDEITGGDFDSLGDILVAFQEQSIQATFFVDTCEVATWGREYIENVCRRIQGAGHDLQLHAHPHHFTGDSKRWLLSEYSREEQEKVLEFAFREFETMTGNRPIAFRAGGFGLDQNTLEILAQRGISIDSSVMVARPGCYVQTTPIGAPTLCNGFRELPMTPVYTLGNRRFPLRVSALDFNWLPQVVIRRAMRSLRAQGAPVVVLLLHSSSLCRRTGARTFTFSRGKKRKLRRLLSWIRNEHMEVATVSELPDEIFGRPAPGEVAYRESNLVFQYWILLQQSLTGAGFNRKFALFLTANVIAWLLVGTLLWKELF